MNLDAFACPSRVAAPTTRMRWPYKIDPRLSITENEVMVATEHAVIATHWLADTDPAIVPG